MTLSIPFIEDHPLTESALGKGSILYTDLDGTLLGQGGSILLDGSGSLSTTTASAIVRVNQAGLPVALCSGRNRIQLAEISRLFGWRGFIAELGCVIVPDLDATPVYHTGDWPNGALLEGETPFEAIARVGALDVLNKAFPGKLEDHAPHHLNREATYVLRGNIDMAVVRDELAALELPVDLMDNGIIHPRHTTLTDVAEVHAYHLAPAGVSKADAIARDLSRRGLTRQEALAIGDSATDVAMADAVSLMALVGNALDDPRVIEAAQSRSNTVATHGLRGDGWIEFVNSWLAAKT